MPVREKRKTIFFDRDGVVNVKLENDYVKSTSEFVFRKNFFSFFKTIKDNNFLAVLVTNQQCIEKKIISEQTLVEIHNWMQEQISIETGYCFDDIYYCPHLNGSGCMCRKPATGMFEAAIKKHSVDVLNS